MNTADYTISRSDVLAGDNICHNDRWSCDRCGADTGIEASQTVPEWALCNDCWLERHPEKCQCQESEAAHESA